jgi:serine/threonine protein kinase/Tol biopolymer transport system component
MQPERWQQIERLYHSALELEASQRAHFLEEACTDDDALRRQVESLLAHGEATGSFLEVPAFEAAAQVMAREQVQAEAMANKNVPMIGETISHYRLLEKLGGGGMGVVFKAVDTRLGRTVALKFLAPVSTKAPGAPRIDPQALERFKREARATSALSHPNICVIHDIGEYESGPFIVMELLEGKTLKDLIEVGARGARPVEKGEHRSPLQIDTLLDLAIQIADGLDAAHSKGVIHRDVKPCNILVTQSGQAKILDFGLAKLNVGPGPGDPRFCDGAPAFSDEATRLPQGVALQDAPTAMPSASLTSPGMTLGTVAYMSPEQARGEELDARTDLFSFGTVLYEMATRQHPFEGGTAADVMAAILTRTPQAPTELNTDVPPELGRIIFTALEKNRDLRYQSAADLRADLTRLKRDTDSGRSTGVSPGVRTIHKSHPPRRWLLALAGALAVVTIALSLAWFVTHRSPGPPPQLSERRLTTNSPENPVTQGAISPDGNYLAYGDRAGLHLKLIKTGETVTIPQPEGPDAPSPDSWWPNGWFPDGTKFIAASTTPCRPVSAWVVPVTGGPPRKLREDADPWSVSPDGTMIAFGTGNGFMRSREVWLMGPQGEDARRFVAGSDDDGYFWAAWSPNGQRIAYGRFHRKPASFEYSIESRDLRGGEPKLLLSDPRLSNEVDVMGFLWFSGGRFVFAMVNNLWEMSVDKSTGEPVSKPRRITNWAGTVLGYFCGTPDGKRLAATEMSGQDDIYIGEFDANRRRLNNPRRLTLNDNNDNFPTWTPDSKAVLFRSDRNGMPGIFTQALDQAEAQQLLSGLRFDSGAWLSPDGSWILGRESATPASGRIMRAPRSGGTPQLVLETRGLDGMACAQSRGTNCVFGEQSPDGRQVIITSFDPILGRGQELTRITRDLSKGYCWSLSQDGSRLAFTQIDNHESRIQILPLRGGKAREVNVKGWSALDSLSWAADGKGLFAVGQPTSTSVVGVYVDLNGRATVYWEQLAGHRAYYAAPSPDGRHLAIWVNAQMSNVWLLENF